MKKIGIITLNKTLNFGNRLQNYALQQVLASLGYASETILVERSGRLAGARRSWLQRLAGLRFLSGRQICHRLLRLLPRRQKAVNAAAERRRTAAFSVFCSRYLRQTEFVIREGHVPPDLATRYTAFIVGSDQVWNPAYTHGSPLFFLHFAEPRQRIAFAASFGVSRLPAPWRKRYRRLLPALSHLSVREQAGAELVASLTGRTTAVHPDPTLLLAASDWLTLARDNRPICSQPYLLTCFLSRPTAAAAQKLRRLSRQLGLRLVAIGDGEDNAIRDIGPAGFIALVRDCQLCCTDSYHSTVFALLLEKPFVVFERSGPLAMQSRIATLLDLFCLQGRTAARVRLEDVLQPPDQQAVSVILARERSRALAYLQAALTAAEEP